MSTVEVTDLVPGTPATSTAVNQTLSSWNTGTAAGQVDGTNVRVEGVDRWVMNPAGNVVEMDTEAAEYEEASPSLATAASTALSVVSLAGGTSDMVTPAALNLALNSDVVVHASVRVYSEAIAPAALPEVVLHLQYSTDAGGTWTSFVGSRRRYQMRETDDLCSINLSTTIPGIDQTATWAHWFVSLADDYLFRVAFENTDGVFTFDSGVISPQVFLK